MHGTAVLNQMQAQPAFNTYGVVAPGVNTRIGGPVRGVTAVHGGAYKFTVTVDDDVKLWVDHTLVINQWIDEPATTYTASVNLSAGTHMVTVSICRGRGPRCFPWAGGGAGGDAGTDQRVAAFGDRFGSGRLDPGSVNRELVECADWVFVSVAAGSGQHRGCHGRLVCGEGW